MDEIYKRIQDGLSRWMKSVGMSRRDEFREGLGSSRVRHICIFCAKGVLKIGEDKSYFCIVITKMSVSKMGEPRKMLVGRIEETFSVGWVIEASRIDHFRGK